MDIHQSRAERTAAHLRQELRSGRWREPLPNGRDWARLLGVGRNTLIAATEILRKEGLLRIEPRQGLRLGRKALRAAAHHPKAPASSSDGAASGGKVTAGSGGGRGAASGGGVVSGGGGASGGRRVRVVSFGQDGLTTGPMFAYLDLLLLRFQQHDIQVLVERATDERLRRICSARPSSRSWAQELTMLSSVPEKFQAMAARSGGPFLLTGRPARGVDLPFITVDYLAAVRHAAQHLLRRGCRRLALFVARVDNPGNWRICEEFRAACRDWPHQPVAYEVLRVRRHPNAERAAFVKFAEGVRGPCGAVLVVPLSVSVLMTLLLGRGISVPGQVQLAAVATLPDSVRVYPCPAHYPYPGEQFVRALADAAVHFFTSGSVPRVQRLLPMELVPAS